MFFKNIKNKELRRLILGVIAIIIFVSSFFLYKEISIYFELKEYCSVSISDSIQGIIKEVYPCEYEKCSKIAHFKLTSEKKYFFYTEGYPSYRDNIRFQLTKGDEIIKASNSETIFVVKNIGDTLLYLLQKPASYYDTIIIQPFGQKLSIKQNN